MQAWTGRGSNNESGVYTWRHQIRETPTHLPKMDLGDTATWKEADTVLTLFICRKLACW